MKNNTIHLLLIAIAIAFASCTPSKLLTIDSDPQEAEVFIKKIKVGETPLKAKVEFPKKGDVGVQLVKKNFEDFNTKLSFEPKEKTAYLFDLTAKEAVEVQLIDFQPLQTKKGIRLQNSKIISLAYLETIERSPNVKSVTRVTNIQDSTVQVGGPNISPKGDAIVYSLYEFEKNDPLRGYANIYRTPVGSASQTKISFGSRLDLYPSYDPTGDFIYFCSNRITDNPTIWKVRSAGGGGLTSITNGSSEDIAPSVFGDGEEIAYTSLLVGTQESQIWKIKKTGTLPTQLREGEYPHVSLATNKIAYVKADRNYTAMKINLAGDTIYFNPKQLWTMTDDGGEETQMTQNLLFNCIQPRWSPDGEWIAYASNEGKDNRGRDNYDIWMIKSDGTQKTQLTTNGSWDDNPSWSPDGKKIYFRSNRGGVWNIWYFEPIME